MPLFLVFLVYFLDAIAGLPLNSPLLDSYDYIGQDRRFSALRSDRDKLLLTSLQSLEAAPADSPWPTAFPRTRVSMSFFSNLARLTTINLGSRYPSLPARVSAAPTIGISLRLLKHTLTASLAHYRRAEFLVAVLFSMPCCRTEVGSETTVTGWHSATLDGAGQTCCLILSR